MKSKKIGNNLNDNFKEDHSIDVTVYGKRQTEAYVLMKNIDWELSFFNKSQKLSYLINLSNCQLQYH